MIAAAKRAEQARLLNFVRLSDYLVTDGLRVTLTTSLEEVLYEIRNVNATKEHEDSLFNIDPSIEEEIDETIDDEDNVDDTPPISQDLLPSTQYFLIELFIRDEILTFDPSYKFFETQVMKYVLIK